MQTPKSVIQHNTNKIENLKAHFDYSETVYNNTKEITFKNIIKSTDNFILLTYYYSETHQLWVLCQEGTNDENGDKTADQIEAHFKQALKSKMKKAEQTQKEPAAKLKEVASVEITEMNDEQLDELFEVLEDQLNSCEVEDYQENCESSEDTHQLNNKIEYLEALIERSQDQEQIEQYKSTIQQMKAQIEQESAEPKVAIIGGRRFGLTQSVNKALASNLSHLSFHKNLSEIMIERKAEELLKLAERKYKESEKIENTSYLLGMIHAVEFLTGKIDENPADIKL